jgi:hypothetical protein
MPATNAALTTAQFSEFVLTSRMSPPPRALTKPREGETKNTLYFSIVQKIFKTCVLLYKSHKFNDTQSPQKTKSILESLRYRTNIGRSVSTQAGFRTFFIGDLATCF